MGLCGRRRDKKRDREGVKGRERQKKEEVGEEEESGKLFMLRYTSGREVFLTETVRSSG